MKLQEDALGNPWPGPLFKLWRASHPPLGERIEFSNDYHPWRDGAAAALRGPVQAVADAVAMFKRSTDSARRLRYARQLPACGEHGNQSCFEP